MSSGTMVDVGLVMAEGACDVDAREAGEGEGIALKSTQFSISLGSMHWLDGCEKLMAPKCVVAIRLVSFLLFRNRRWCPIEQSGCLKD